MNNYYNPYELYHHGIIGQKWGVRRFQNRDGTYTSAGKRRRNAEDGGSSSGTGVGKKIAKGLAIGAAAGLTAYALANPKSRAFLKRVASASATKLKAAATSPKVKDFVTTNGKKAVKSLGDSVKRGGKAATDAAIASIGAIAVSKLATKIDTTSPNLDEATRNRNQVLLDAASAGIKAAVNGGSSNNSGNKYKSGPIDREKGAEISKIVGPPRQKEIDRTGSEYQALFKDRNGNQRDSDTRSIIKSMASAGYGVDQIAEYLSKIDDGTIKHSEMLSVLSEFMAADDFSSDLVGEIKMGEEFE